MRYLTIWLNIVIRQSPKQLDRIFFALSDPTRRALIANLAAKGSCSVLELAKPFNVSLPAVSKHLKLLEKANLVKRTREGRTHHLKLSAGPMSEVNDWLKPYVGMTI
jgi:DNA-binding transcriptional ArsR family regulator